MPAKKDDLEQMDPMGDNVGQIREILFGGQIRAIDDRFENVEKRLAKESEKLRKALENRMLKLEKLLIQFREDASDELNQEGDKMTSAVADVDKALSGFRQDAANQMAALQAEYVSEFRQLRDDLAAATKALNTELDRQDKSQDKRSGQLDAQKVDRVELADFLNDIASRLKPGKKPRKAK
jgi:recombinational DNA repair ATPase RecF